MSVTDKEVSVGQQQGGKKVAHGQTEHRRKRNTQTLNNGCKNNHIVKLSIGLSGWIYKRELP